MIDAYQAVVDLRLKHRVWPQVNETADFRVKTSAFSVLSSFDILAYVGLPADLDWAFAPFPKGATKAKASPQAYVFDHKLAKGVGAAQREHGWAFMRWLTDKSRLSTFEGRLPAVKEDIPRWSAEVFKARPNTRQGVLAEAYDQAARPELIWLHPKWASDMNGLLTKEFWDPAFSGQKPVASGLREMKPRLEAITGG
jgi:ABC-type glycerol-3-phosphate transport system substrate-binding protein